MSWELYGGGNIQFICLRLTFEEIPQIFGGCPEGCFLRVWVSKKTPGHPAGLKTMAESLQLIPGILQTYL